MIDPERRMRIYYIPQHLVTEVLWNLLQRFQSNPDAETWMVRLPNLAPLPDDARLLEVRHCWERRSFGFLFSSASFPVVPDGVMIPEENEPLCIERLAVRVIRVDPNEQGGYL